MISKEKIIQIIAEETWVEMDSARVYGIEDAAEKVLQAIEAAQQGVQADGAAAVVEEMSCPECGAVVGHLIANPPRGYRKPPEENKHTL
jgi:hypothetical protein